MITEREALFATFSGIPDILEAYFRNIQEEYLDRKRGESVWTIKEHLYHLAGVQELMYHRILTIKTEENPAIRPYFPVNEPNRASLFPSVEAAFNHYRDWRRKQTEVLRGLTEMEFNKEAVHDEYIRYNIPILVNHIISHDYWHMYRIEELWLTKDEYFS